MKSFKIKILVNLIAICSVILFCNAQNSSNAQTQTTEEKKSSLQKGMDPIFDMYHSFLDTVMPYNFYDESDSPFSVQDIIDIAKNDEYDKVQDEWQNLVKTFGGFAACIVCGLLFIVFMPIVGCIYCCCSCCCHKCSCTREQNDPKHAKCKRVTYTSLLLICTTLMLAGVIITFLGAELLHRSLKNEDNEGLMGGLDESLGHMQTFVNNTLKDIKREAQERIIDDGLGGILKSITETAITTVDRVENVINATSLLNQADSIGQAAETALSDLQTVNTSLTTLTVLQTNVTTTLEKVKTDVNSVCGQAACQGLDISSLTFQPNFTALPMLINELSKVQQANNITGLVAQARLEFEKISGEVNSSVEREIQEANKLIDDLTNTINNALGNLDGSSKSFVDAMADGKSFATDEEEQIRKVGNYIWYSCIGMACAVLLVVVFYYLGVLFGLCGERPSPEAACCNKGTGSNLLYAGICCSFIFCWLLMLVVLATFTLGGLSYTMACQYLNDGVEHVDTFEDVISEGFGWNVSNAFNTTNLTIAGMFENCKNDQGVYTALNLKHLFDVDKEFDVSSVNDEVLKIVNTTNLNIGSITLLSPDLKQQLDDFTKSNISSVNYTEYIVEIEKDLFSANLSTIITELNQTADILQQQGNATAADTLRNASSELAVVRDVVQPDIQTEVQHLKDSVTSLQQNSNVTAQVNSLITNIENSEQYFNDKRNEIVQEQLREAAEGILTSIETTVNNTKDSIKYEIGKCRPLYDAAQAVVDSVCIVTLDPLNAIWFGLGWSLFFYIPSFIFAALLSSLYRRSEKYVPYLKPDFDDVTPYSGYDNGYLGGRQDEQYPLTRIDNGRSRQVGSHNYAYEGRDSDPDSRYHRDGHSAQPYHVGYPSQGAGRDSRGPTYATPNAGSQDFRQGYEPAQPPRYDDVTSHGRRYGDHGGYPKLRNY